MLFGLSHREKRVKKINLLHFPVFTSKNFVILELPEPSTDSTPVVKQINTETRRMRIEEFLSLVNWLSKVKI